jgi:hypothetical protein
MHFSWLWRVALEEHYLCVSGRDMNWLSNLTTSVARIAGVISPSCKQATRLQSQSMDRNLSLWEKLGLRIHLLLCKWCRRYRQQLGFLRSAASQCDDHHVSQPSQGLSTEARDRIKQKIKASQQ